MKYRLKTVKWSGTRLDLQAQDVMICHTNSSWKPMMNGVPMGSILDPVLFNICKYLENQAEATPKKIGNLGQGGDLTEGQHCHPKRP